jgi:hypothetical protein
VEEWEPLELLVHSDGGDEDGEGTPSRRRRYAGAELASALDRGLDAQPVPIPDWRLDGLAIRGWSVEKETPVMHALEAAAPARWRRIDNKILKTEATWPATQPADDGAFWRHRPQERIT